MWVGRVPVRFTVVHIPLRRSGHSASRARVSTLAQTNGTAVAKLRRDTRRAQNEKHNSSERSCLRHGDRNGYRRWTNRAQRADVLLLRLQVQSQVRSEERRVGKEGRSRWSPY